jgi:CheY-like chemotaxis protein
MRSRILVVDDEEPVSSMLKVILIARGYEVTAAASARQAVSLLNGTSFDLVLTDMKMETETAGYDVVRAASSLPHAPAILILTAYPLLAGEWRAAGADAILPKPSQISTLLDAITDLLQRRHSASHRS